ncbi:MAG: exo-alpha-sialidase [Paludibacteraceae bacterium]|nr:exo-alpha-sialidase [Paludibacteraceae bacterium]
MKHSSLYSLFAALAFVLLLSLSACTSSSSPSDNSQTYSLTVSRIWANDHYCSFTSLVRFRGRYFCTFREAVAHHYQGDAATAGNVRVIVSDNGTDWQPLALFAIEGMDLRDPKLSITPDGRLMLLIGGVLYEGKEYKGSYTKVTFSSDGQTFTELQDGIIDPAVSTNREWLWRLTWFGETGYVVSYGPTFNLLQTTDGIHYDLVSPLAVTGRPNETTVRLTTDSTMYLMIRREEGDHRGMWGKSRPPYTDWQWTEMDIPLGGPEFVILSDTATVVATRSLYSTEKTMLFKGGLDGHFEEVCILPSGGDDNSYAGMIIEGDELWVSYYSCHEQTMAAIYMARLPMSWFTQKGTNKYFYKL